MLFVENFPKSLFPNLFARDGKNDVSRSARGLFFGRLFKDPVQEDRLVDTLASLPFFRDGWTIYQNVALSDASQDTLDVVLVGPTGVYAIEVRSDSNNHQFKHDVWRKELSYGRWQTIEWHPLKQAEHNAKRLQSYLSRRGINLMVEARIFWKGGYLALGDDVHAVWFPRNRLHIVNDIEASRMIDRAIVQQINDALKNENVIAAVP